MRRKEVEMTTTDTQGATLPKMEGGDAPLPLVNDVRLVGSLIKQPFMKDTRGGEKMASFMLKVTRVYYKANERREDRAYVPVVAFRALAAQVEPLGKDSVVSVSGYLRTWSQDDGKSYRWQVQSDSLEVLERREPARDAGRVPSSEEAAV
ncbi:MAG: single-stranded DNA-binding protein [Elusimicrobia bacterium]|nr:single-stranded DNA-binding protein [Elusimicrobiota bacterium]